jgi:hypothetical protein
LNFWDFWLKASCLSHSTSSEKLTEISDLVRTFVKSNNFAGVIPDVEQLRRECETFVFESFHVSPPNYNFRVLDTQNYVNTLNAISRGFAPPQFLFGSSGITIQPPVINPSTILLNVELIMNQANNNERQFSIVLVLTLMEEMCHLARPKIKSETKIKAYRNCFTQKYLQINLDQRWIIEAKNK